MRYLLVLSLLFTVGCRTGDGSPDTDPVANAGPAEVPVQRLAMDGPLADAESEISGLAWYGAQLVLLPQYPSRVDNSVYTISRSALDAAIDGSTPTLSPKAVPLVAPGLDGIAGFQGYEAIAFDGDTAWVTIECEPGKGMLGWLVKGTMSGSELVLDPATRQQLAPLGPIGNMAFEAVIVTPDGPLAFYEANGVVSSPVALSPGRDPVPMPRVPFRITDATDVQDGRFWVINYFWPGDDKLAGADPIARKYGKGPTHAASDTVERLVELQLGAGIAYTSTPPIQLELGDKARNWEGVVRHRDGFVLATDKFPETILAYVKAPAADQ